MTPKEQANHQQTIAFLALTKKYGEPNNERTHTLSIAMAKHCIEFLIIETTPPEMDYWEATLQELDNLLLP